MNEIIHIYTKNFGLFLKAEKNFFLMILMIFSQSFSTSVRFFLISIDYVKSVLLIVIIGPFLIQTPLALLAVYKGMGLFWILIAVVVGQFLMLIAYFYFVYDFYSSKKNILA